MPDNDHLSLGRVAKLCHVSRTTAYRWIINGRLRGYATPGGHFRVAPNDLSDFCRAHGIPDPLVEGSPSTESDSGLRATPKDRPPQILIADDHPDMVVVLRRVVERYAPHAEIHESVNGVDTCIAAATLRPALILLDIMMPGMDGFAVLQELLRRPELGDSRVIVVSAYEPFERILDLEQQYKHVVACLRKPIQIEQLGDRVTQVLAEAVTARD